MRAFGVDVQRATSGRMTRAVSESAMVTSRVKSSVDERPKAVTLMVSPSCKRRHAGDNRAFLNHAADCTVSEANPAQ